MYVMQLFIMTSFLYNVVIFFVYRLFETQHFSREAPVLIFDLFRLDNLKYHCSAYTVTFSPKHARIA